MEIDAWSNNKKTCCWETESSPINAGGKGDDYLSYQSARRSCLSRKSLLAAICWTSFRRSINHRQEISGLGRNYHFILTCFGLGSRDRSFSDYPLPYFICINSAACAYSSSTLEEIIAFRWKSYHTHAKTSSGGALSDFFSIICFAAKRRNKTTVLRLDHQLCSNVLLRSEETVFIVHQLFNNQKIRWQAWCSNRNKPQTLYGLENLPFYNLRPF